jgi:hypothetical protein
MNGNYHPIKASFNSTADVPRDDNIFYHCLTCDGVVPSVPLGNMGCACGNIFIDKDYMRLIVVDFTKFEAMKTNLA